MSIVNTADEPSDSIDWKFFAQIPTVPVWVGAALACNVPPSKMVRYDIHVPNGYIIDGIFLTAQELYLFQNALDISVANLGVELKLSNMPNLPNPERTTISIKEYVAFAKKLQWTCSEDFYSLGHNHEENDICGTKERNTNAKIIKALLALAELNPLDKHHTANLIQAKTKALGCPVGETSIVLRIEQALNIKLKKKFGDL